MTSGILLLFVSLFLAYTNGANDNFKGVATLFGSGASGYKRALYWATVTTFMGSVAALFFSKGLVAVFSGNGLVPNNVVQAPAFIFSAGLGASATVCFATLAGVPISTTHALVGGLVGAGIAGGESVHFQKLFNSFFLPLLFSPLISMVLTLAIYPPFRKIRKLCGVNGEMCLCVDGKEEIVEITPSGAAVLKSTGFTLTIDQMQGCQTRYQGIILGLNIHDVLNWLHYFTAGALCFARGLNDTPKMVGLLLVAGFFEIQNAILWIGIAMGIGGLLNARKVAQTMSRRITAMNHGQGFTANLVASVLVIFASLVSMPVSTTHVTCGALFGIGLVNGEANFSMIRNILISWIVTLPLAGLFSATVFVLVK